jgi:hypothetical protein
MMNRRAFVTGLGAVLAAPLAAEAQQAGRIYRLGILSPAPFTSLDVIAGALRELGYVEGQNLAVDRRYAEAIPTDSPRWHARWYSCDRTPSSRLARRALERLGTPRGQCRS